MKFLEDFFSTENIIYPIICSIGFGLLIKFFSFITKIMLTDSILIIFMVLGFCIGNYIKVLKIQEDDEIKEKTEITTKGN